MEQHCIVIRDAKRGSVPVPPVRWLRVGTRPRFLLYNATNSKVYCSCQYSDSISIIHGESNNVIAEIDAGNEPYGMAWSPSHNRTFVAVNRDASVAVLRDVTAIAEQEEVSFRTAGPPSLVTHGSLLLSEDRPGILYDMTGKRVTGLAPGPNDLSCLKPGVYFANMPPDRDIIKIVLAR